MALGDLSGGGKHPVLDLIALGAVLLDGEGRVIHANRAARDMAQAASLFTIRSDRLRPSILIAIPRHSEHSGT